MVVDDQELVRSGLDVVGRTQPDVVLMDVRRPRLDGIEATRRIVVDHPAARVLALTTFDLDEYIYSAARAGASGLLPKDVSPAPEVLAGLAGREVEVLRLELFLSEATVKTYVSRLLATLNARDRVQLAVIAYETGLVRVGVKTDKRP